MKTEELKEQGLTDEQIKFVMRENGKDVAAAKGDLEKVTAERDKLQSQYDDASKTLEKYKDVDVDGLKADIESWKKKAEDTENDYKEKLYQRDYDDALRAALSESNLKDSKSIRRGIEARIREEGLKLKDGKILGLNDLLEQIKADDPEAFVDVKKQELEGKKAKFTEGMNKDNNAAGNGSKSNAETWKAMTLDERIALKASDPDRYAELKGN